MHIREADSKDNQALLKLSRETPMQGSISIYVDRFPNYFYLPSLQGYDSKVFVAERDGDIIGVIGVSFRNVRLFGNLIKIGYTGGLKIKESAKGSRTLYRLMKRTYDEMLEKNAQLGILFALKENQKVLRIISGRVNIPKFYPIANFKVFHIFPLLKFKIKNKYEIERLSKSNLQEIEKFFLRFFKRYELVEEFNNEKVSKILKESKDFSLDNFFIARQNGRIVATISYWNQIGFKKTIVQRYGGLLKLLYYLLKPFGFLPAPGNPIQVLELRHLVYEEEHLEAAKNLIRFICNRFRSQFKLIRIGFHSRDPLIQALKGFLKIEMEIVLYAAFKEEDSALIEKLRNSLIWEDMTLH